MKTLREYIDIMEGIENKVVEESYADQQSPQRTPLTWEQKLKLVSKYQEDKLNEYDLIEMVEAAHGIKGEARSEQGVAEESLEESEDDTTNPKSKVEGLFR